MLRKFIFIILAAAAVAGCCEDTSGPTGGSVSGVVYFNSYYYSDGSSRARVGSTSIYRNTSSMLIDSAFLCSEPVNSRMLVLRLYPGARADKPINALCLYTTRGSFVRKIFTPPDTAFVSAALLLSDGRTAAFMLQSWTGSTARLMLVDENGSLTDTGIDTPAEQNNFTADGGGIYCFGTDNNLYYYGLRSKSSEIVCSIPEPPAGRQDPEKMKAFGNRQVIYMENGNSGSILCAFGATGRTAISAAMADVSSFCASSDRQRAFYSALNARTGKWYVMQYDAATGKGSALDSVDKGKILRVAYYSKNNSLLYVHTIDNDTTNNAVLWEYKLNTRTKARRRDKIVTDFLPEK